MSLLEDAYEDFSVLEKTEISDGKGGQTTTWVESKDTIKGAIPFTSSSQLRTAEAMKSKNSYVFIVKRDVELNYHTVLKRSSDDRIFRITSNSDDLKTPIGAGLDMRQYTAEEWTLP